MRAEARSPISVSPTSVLRTRRRLLAALEEAFPVRFCAAGPDARADATLLLTTDVPRAHDRSANTGRVFAALAAPTSRADAAESVKLLGSGSVDRRVRGITLSGCAAAEPLATITAAETVLAVASSGAAWAADGDAHRVSSILPELQPDQVLRDLLVSPHALSLIALVHFLRHLPSSPVWTPPVLKATMLFDDPNLRRPRYGFIDFGALVAHADAHDYHAAMAMIPLDAAGPHRATVDLFRRRRDRLSLVVHGNNHVSRELSRPAGAGRELAIAAQAVRRIDRFEARHGLRVDRVMTPPHGMCSPEMSHALGTVGFDALCALHPLPWREGSPSDRLLAGWEAAEFAGPCAVIPRMPLFASAADIALHAFLDHPVVLYGHHEDLAHGLDPLAAAAERVNAVGPVEWTPMDDIVLGNRAVRIAGGTMLVRPFSGRMRVVMPDAAQALVVLAPRHAGEHFAGWSVGSGAVRPFGDAVPCPEGERRLELRLRPVDEIDPASVRPPRSSPWPILRRGATELRDRALPFRAMPPPGSSRRTRA